MEEISKDIKLETENARSFIELKEIYIVDAKYSSSGNVLNREVANTYVFSCSIRPKGEQLEVLLKVSVEDEAREVNLSVEVCGIFEIDKEAMVALAHPDKGNRGKLVFEILTKNTVTIIFPYLRSYVSTFSSMTSMGEVKIPIFNINKALSQTPIEE